MSQEQYEIRWVDYYAVREIPPLSEDELVIKQAYHKLACQWHQRANLGDSEAIEKMKLINEAWE